MSSAFLPCIWSLLIRTNPTGSERGFRLQIAAAKGRSGVSRHGSSGTVALCRRLLACTVAARQGSHLPMLQLQAPHSASKTLGHGIEPPATRLARETCPKGIIPGSEAVPTRGDTPTISICRSLSDRCEIFKLTVVSERLAIFLLRYPSIKSVMRSSLLQTTHHKQSAVLAVVCFVQEVLLQAATVVTASCWSF